MGHVKGSDGQVGLERILDGFPCRQRILRSAGASGALVVCLGAAACSDHAQVDPTAAPWDGSTADSPPDHHDPADASDGAACQGCDAAVDGESDAGPEAASDGGEPDATSADCADEAAVDSSAEDGPDDGGDALDVPGQDGEGDDAGDAFAQDDAADVATPDAMPLDAPEEEDGAEPQDGSADAAEIGMQCVPSATSCVDAFTTQTCAADGLTQSLAACPSARPYCVDDGACVECRNLADCSLDPAEPCRLAACASGNCSVEPAPSGTPCSSGVCDGLGACVDCLPSTRRCSGAVPEVCDASGVWQPEEACPFVCVSGECAGECLPATRRCDGNTPQLCDEDGAWQPLSSCSGVTPECFKGICEPPTPLSCAGLEPTCGPDADDLCCRQGSVPGGAFYRSYDAVSFTDKGYPATVSAFALDIYEVTVSRFRAFVDAGAGTQVSPPAAGAGSHPKIPNSGWVSSWNSSLAVDSDALRAALKCSPSFQSWTDSPGLNDSRPINCVSWFDAFAFCAWDGARLPTEAEWNYVAAGGDQQRVRPWSVPPESTALDPGFASYWTDPTNQCMGDLVPACTLDDLVPVGSKPRGAGPWGHFELAGNVWEWTLDLYNNPYAINPCIDCAQLSGSSNRVIRGGSFFGNPTTVMNASRGIGAPAARLYSVGLRCARDP